MTVLQKFGFKDSPYQRPHDKWVCGHLAEGKPCPLGPDMHGKCGAKAACEPHLEDGRWQCRRSALEGGPCEKGPLPDGRCCLQQGLGDVRAIFVRYKRRRVAYVERLADPR